MSTQMLKRFVCVCLLLLLSLFVSSQLHQSFIPEVSANPDVPLMKWIYFRDHHPDYGQTVYQKYINQCEWIAAQNDIDLVLGGGDWQTGSPYNLTDWDMVAEGIQKFNSSITFLANAGNHDATYNASKGAPFYADFDNYLAYTGMSSPNYTYTFSDPNFGDIMIISMALRYNTANAYFYDDEGTWDWFDNVVNSTDLPVVVLMEPAPALRYVLHRYAGAYDSYWDNHISKHENIFLVLFAHSHETQYYIAKGDNGNPVLILSSYANGLYGVGLETGLAVLSWYEDRLEVKNYDAWTNTWYNSTRDGETITLPFYGVQALESGHLRNDDFSRTGNNDTDIHSSPKSYYPAYSEVLKMEITKNRTEYWFQMWAHLENSYMDRSHTQAVYKKGVNAKAPVEAKWKNNYFYPNGTTTVNASLPEGWYNYIFFINETSETYSVYVYNTSGSLKYSGSFNFIETLSGFDYGYKNFYMRPYGYFDDLAVTYDTTVTTASGTTITLSNGTQITSNSFDLRQQTGAIMLLNCTVTIGDETRVMDIYGGDEIGTFYNQRLLLSRVKSTNDNLKNSNNPYIINSTRSVSSLSYASNKLTFTVSASSGTTSTTKVYCGDKGKPSSVTGAEILSYDSKTKIVTLNVLHTNSKEIIVQFEQTPPTTTISLSGVLGSNDWFISEVMVTLSAVDNISGVDRTEYSFDNVTWNVYVIPFTISTEGYTTVYYKSVDKAGNVETIKTEMLKIDKAAPTGYLIINNGDTYTSTTTVALTLLATDVMSDVAHMRFSHDNSSWTSWEDYAISRAGVLTTGDGTKNIFVQFRDNAGIISQPYIDTIILDTTPPSGSISIADDSAYTYSTRVSLTLSANDAASGVAEMRFSNDNTTWSDWEAYATSRSWTLLTGDGIRGVTVQYKDNVGLISTTYQDTIILDTTKPVADAGINQTVAEDTEVTFNGSASWNENGIARYTWIFTDVTTKTLIGEKPTYIFNTPGVYTITLNVTDAAGRWATDIVLITVVDITNPVANAGQDQTVNVGTAVTFDASDSTDNVDIASYKWDFGDGTTGTGITTTHTYTSTGNHTITLTTTDAAGNIATHQITVTVLPVEAFPMWIIGAIIVAGIVITIALALWRKNHS